ncbi:hypothetical protein FRC03_005785 [Tulasnella sp. 419]|nr:hypothetical protein FRC03_005785 [Tulasnella sp. 419]
MPPRRIQFSQADIDTQLQQIHLLDQSSSSENLESLAPLIKTVVENNQVEAFLRTTQGLVESKEQEIERICGDNYQDFVSSVSTLLTVRSYTHNLRDRITTLDSSVSSVGKTLASKKRTLLESKKTATHLDEAIDTLQACLRVLDLVNRVGAMIKDGKYWSALKSLDDVESLPQTSLSQTPFFEHLLSSLPSLRAQIKDAVTASMKSWLLEIRNTSGLVGRLALDAMKTRARRWKTRQEKDHLLKPSKVGSPVELVISEKLEYNVLDNDQISIDFKPLYQCIHIYTTLDSLEELQRSYQADRKAQASLILSDRILPGTRNLSLTLLPLTEDIVGFFIIESQVLRTTRAFRYQREVEDLWENVAQKVKDVVEEGLRDESDVDVFLLCKDSLLAFVQTMEGYSYDTSQLQSLVFSLVERYSALLERSFGTQFSKAVMENDFLAMYISTPDELETVLAGCYLKKQKIEDLLTQPIPITLPFSSMFPLCCGYVRQYVDKFYQFVEGVSHHHRDIDSTLLKSLDQLLVKHVAEPIANRLRASRNMSTIAQMISDIDCFHHGCQELGQQLTKLRAAHRGGTMILEATNAFGSLSERASIHLNSAITNKLSDFFDLAEYEWTPSRPDTTPSVYLYDMVMWLTGVIDGLAVTEEIKGTAYKAALEHIAGCMMNFLVGPEVPSINDNGLSNLLVDIRFLEDYFQQNGKPEFMSVFSELKSMISIPLNDNVSSFLTPPTRQASYPHVQPKRLASLLEKMARYGQGVRIRSEFEKGEKRRLEAQAVARMQS